MLLFFLKLKALITKIKVQLSSIFCLFVHQDKRYEAKQQTSSYRVYIYHDADRYYGLGYHHPGDSKID